MATLITLLDKCFDNIDNMLASERAEREKLEQELRSTRRHRKRSASPSVKIIHVESLVVSLMNVHIVQGMTSQARSRSTTKRRTILACGVINSTIICTKRAGMIKQPSNYEKQAAWPMQPHSKEM